jgi:hypothetical protein
MEGDAFIERRFRLGSTEFSCRFFRPLPDPSGVDFRCTYAIDWPTRRRTSYACGVDPVQALILAMQKAHIDLLSSPEYAAGTLLWLDTRELGLPLPKNISEADFQKRDL